MGRVRELRERGSVRVLENAKLKKWDEGQGRNQWGVGRGRGGKGGCW